MKTASLAALALLAPALAVASPAAERTADGSAAPRRVRSVERATQSGGHLVPASVLAARRATVATRIAAHVAALHVEEGWRVRRGDLLVSLSDPDLRGALAAAESAHAAAAAHERRIRALAAERAATASELELATAQRAQAEAAVAAARANLGYAQIRAPFAGTIQARRVSAGDMVGPGQPLLELEGDELELQASLTEAEAGGLAVGSALPFVAGKARGTAEITALTPGGDPVSHRRGLRARVRKVDGELRSGAFARLEVPGAPEDGGGAWVPRSALVERGDLTGVFVASGGKAELRWVSLGESAGDGFAVRAGVRPEETVIDAPGALRDGEAVEVLP
jgi:RND family efflux transporter MFP subunit